MSTKSKLSRFKKTMSHSTSVDSKLNRNEKFLKMLGFEDQEQIFLVDHDRYTYQIDLQYPSSATNTNVHYRITYKVISRNTGSSTIIKLRNIIKTSSRLKQPIKLTGMRGKIFRAQLPRLKIRT